MLILLGALCALTLVGVRFSRFHDDYMGVGQSTAIKGVFALLIVFSHMNSYLAPGGFLDEPYRQIMTMIGQLMVTLFFFYSGYGIFKSWQKKPNYSEGFFRKRVLKVLVHFDLAVALFAVLNLILGIQQTKRSWLLCWFAWGSIGNSNWFVFDTLVFYLITLAAMLLIRRIRYKTQVFCTLITVLCVAFWFGMRKLRGAETWWYDTVLCFPAGLWYGLLQDKIDALAKKTLLWWGGLLCIGAAFLMLYLRRGDIVMYTLCTAVFCVLLVWITMKVRFQNPVLLWLGKRSFSIYILQRIPMILFTYLGWNANKPLFVTLTLVTVFPLAAGFTWVLNWVDKKLFK